MVYNAIYKCRLCGKEYYNAFTIEQTAIDKVLRMVAGRPNDDYFFNATDIHDCDDGSIGYADFLGFRKSND